MISERAAATNFMVHDEQVIKDSIKRDATKSTAVDIKASYRRDLGSYHHYLDLSSCNKQREGGSEGRR